VHIFKWKEIGLLEQKKAIPLVLSHSCTVREYGYGYGYGYRHGYGTPDTAMSNFLIWLR